MSSLLRQTCLRQCVQLATITNLRARFRFLRKIAVVFTSANNMDNNFMREFSRTAKLEVIQLQARAWSDGEEVIGADLSIEWKSNKWML